MSIHVCKCNRNGVDEYHLRYPGMSEEWAQRIADKINYGWLDGSVPPHQRIAAAQAERDALVLDVARHLQIAVHAEVERDEARAEAAALRKGVSSVYTTAYLRGHHDTVEGSFVNVLPVDYDTYFSEDAKEALACAAIEARKGGS